MLEQKQSFVLMIGSGHTRPMFYAVDIGRIVRGNTLGAFAGDPTIPYRPSRLAVLRRRLRTRRAVGIDGRARACCAAALAEKKAA
jgi:hypothetical protein